MPGCLLWVQGSILVLVFVLQALHRLRPLHCPSSPPIPSSDFLSLWCSEGKGGHHVFTTSVSPPPRILTPFCSVVRAPSQAALPNLKVPEAVLGWACSWAIPVSSSLIYKTHAYDLGGLWVWTSTLRRSLEGQSNLWVDFQLLSEPAAWKAKLFIKERTPSPQGKPPAQSLSSLLELFGKSYGPYSSLRWTDLFFSSGISWVLFQMTWVQFLSVDLLSLFWTLKTFNNGFFLTIS